MIVHQQTTGGGVASSNPDIVNLPDWDADHLSPFHLLAFWQEADQPNGDTWSNQPAAVTKFFNDDRSLGYADLRWASQMRFVCEVLAAGASGAEVGVQLSVDGGATWYFADNNDGPTISIATVGLFQSDVVPIWNAFRDENAMYRVAGINGNGVADPKFRSYYVYIR